MPNGISIRDMASIGLPIGSRSGWLLMLRLYIDDTGTHANSPVVGVGGLLGTEPQWESFDTAWKAVLREPYPGAKPLKKWSTSDCLMGDGEFDGYGDAEKDLVTRRFRDVVISSGVFACSNMIDRVAWDEIMPGGLRDRKITPEIFALFRLVERMRRWAPEAESDRNIAVFYDAGRENAATERMASVLNSAKSALPQIASFTFMAVADATPLQGADMIATESYWFAKEYLKHGDNALIRPHFRSYLAENFQRGNGEVFDRECIEGELEFRDSDGRIKPEVWAESRKRLFQQPS